jgi:hypothetical protein
MNRRSSLYERWRTIAAAGSLLGLFRCVPSAVPHQGTCGIAFSGTCRECAETNCCSAAAACADSPGCKVRADCLASCEGAPACRANCASRHSGSEGFLAAELDSCLSVSCEDDCGLTCGGLDWASTPDGAEECQTCLSHKYCEAARECAQDIDCQLYVSCRQDCVTGDCIGSCAIRRLPDAEFCLGKCSVTDCVRPCSSGTDDLVRRYADFFEALGSAECNVSCEWGNDWSCVGSVYWPRVKSSERKFTVGLNPLGESSRSGIDVQMCDRRIADCESHIDQKTTDSEGIVHLLDGSGSVNGVGFGLDGFLKLSSAESSPALIPTRIYWGFPLSESNGALGTPVPIFTLQTIKSLFPEQDQARGLVGAIAVDCFGIAAKDVTITISTEDAAVTRYYLDGTLPDRNATETDENGSAFFINVPIGQHTVTVTPNSTGVTSSRVAIDVRPGTLTQVGLGPTP